jgi:hypothetical protein
VGTDYDELDNKKPGHGTSPDVVQILGWINHDRTLFSPTHGEKESVDDVRLQMAAEWDRSFVAWCSADEARRTQIEQAYQRHFQGFRASSYSAEPMRLTRWNPKRVPHPWQNAGARRVLANRGGLVAFDVGLGKTDCGLLSVAAARQEGWAKRPVILVPKSIVWKWVRDINRALPDYRVGVVGSKRKRVKHGPRAGQLTSDTDTPAERAATWTRFMGGEFDVVVLTYQALARTKMNEESILAYAEGTAAIQREVKLRQRNAAKKMGRKNPKLSERESAILLEGTAAWVAEALEIPEGWAYDPGILWEDIGVDLLVIDEAQNFKNLHLPEPREHGVPRFMGNAGSGSHRAWQVEFRCAAVRRKTGGAGVVLLSATPAKNSPLEFYSLIGYVDEKAFTQQGIYDPEAYVDRYCRIERREVVGTDMDVHTRSACVGFKNLDELRATLFRYGEFRTAEQVGLPIPTPEVRRLEVNMDPRQDEKYDLYVRKIEEALSKPQGSDSILGLLARMSLVSIHADLDAKYTWQTAPSVPSPHSPKFDALAGEILKQPGCGHIVFCDNIAAHAWIRMVLVEVGIPADRIAVLNAEVAEGDVERLRIAMDFNGDPEEGTPPKYDVILANAIAYEGIDLQTRTCAIHHIDLPWEPATLEQRNGRGRRQGNIHANIAIIYYFARRSSDGMRFNLIQGKRGWMTDILESQKKDTNNPGAQDKLGPEEVLLLISRDPAKTQARLDAVKEQRAAEARRKIAEEASATLRGAVARFASAQRARDPQDAMRLRAEANLRLEDLARVDSSAWPWASWAVAAREHPMLVPHDGSSPVYEGLRIATPSTFDPSVTDYAEFGRPFENKTIGARAAGAVAWKDLEVQAVQNLRLRPEHATTAWPEDDDEKMERQMRSLLPRFSRYGAADAWKDLGWSRASGAFVHKAWAKFGADIIDAMRSAGWSAKELKVPVATAGVMSIGISGAHDTVIPPTDAGWEDFLRLGPESRAKWGELEEAGLFWWGRKIPRDLLAAARESPTPSTPTVSRGARDGEEMEP